MKIRSNVPMEYACLFGAILMLIGSIYGIYSYIHVSLMHSGWWVLGSNLFSLFLGLFYFYLSYWSFSIYRKFNKLNVEIRKSSNEQKMNPPANP